MRASGIIMHISSLPSPYGIGTMGREAFNFVDFLHKAGQKYWQVLPIGPTGCGDSPYQSFSAFAGNPYFIDLEILIENGLLTKNEVEAVYWCDSADKVDYGRVYENRWPVLRQAYQGFKKNVPADYSKFLAENMDWLMDYALFMAMKDKFGGQCWLEWGEARFYESEAVKEYRNELREDMNFYCFLQYEFFRQWKALSDYAHDKGIKIIGDVPIYVPLDSADVWSNPELFQLDEERKPTGVAGVPPDYFTADGQLWGNPLYDWDVIEKDNFAWWIKRLSAAGKLFDVIRLDHFRGFASYWNVPYGDKTARGGKWVTGPGKKFIDAINTIEGIEFIAEDLGVLTEDVIELIEYSKLPCMKVLQFAFDPSGTSSYLPHNYEKNCVCYTGTHDNATLGQWIEEANEAEMRFATKYLGLHEAEGNIWGIIRGGMSSVAELFVAQMQDYLEIGEEGRMNMPGFLNGQNWRWRAAAGQITDELAKKIGDMTRRYSR